MVRPLPRSARGPGRLSTARSGAVADLGRRRRQSGSAVRAGTFGLPMALAIIGGMPERFSSFANLYRAAGRRAGHDPALLKLSINSHGLIADTSQHAADIAFPPFATMMNRIGQERDWPPCRAPISKLAHAAWSERRRQRAGSHRQDPVPVRDLPS